MKIYGFFRGFPGLGRVVSGISILSTLKEMGNEVRAYSYLQGVQALNNHNVDILLEKQPDQYHIMAIGLNPICEVSGELIERICSEDPDIVIVDGEPLFISTLAMVYPREKILSLLNPADLFNDSLPISTMKFYHNHYLAAGSAIVHGVDKNNITLPKNTRGCDILKTTTILRREVMETPVSEKTEVVAILGGGSSNSSESFWHATVDMGKKIIDAATILDQERFVIYCNDSKIAGRLSEYVMPQNIRIVLTYTMPQNMYATAKVILCRAGRNTISEILYLDLPAILMSSYGDFRSSEQGKNINLACALKPGRLLKLSQEEDGKTLSEKIWQVINAENNGYRFLYVSVFSDRPSILFAETNKLI